MSEPSVRVASTTPIGVPSVNGFTLAFRTLGGSSAHPPASAHRRIFREIRVDA